MTSSSSPVGTSDLHQSRQHLVVAWLVLFIFLGNSSVAAKLVAQYRINKKFFAEDVCLVVALASCNAVCASYLIAVHYGLGLHFDLVVADDPQPPHRVVKLFYHLWIPAVFNAPAFGGIKFALLFLYRRLLLKLLIEPTWFKIAWWTNLIYLTLWCFGSLFYYIFACVPPSYYWNGIYAQFGDGSVHGYCVKNTTPEFSLPLIFAVVQDFALLLIPITTLWVLLMRMTMREKMGLISLFSLGLIACLLEISRIIELVVNSGDHGFFKLVDPTWQLCGFVIMTCAVEMIGLMCACFPVVGPHVMTCFRYIAASWQQTTPVEDTHHLDRHTGTNRLDGGQKSCSD